MPNPAAEPDPDSHEAQMQLLEKIVGDLPAFKPGQDTGQGILAPEGQEANAFFQSFNPPQLPEPAAQQNNNGEPVSPKELVPTQPALEPARPATAPQPGGRLFAGKYRSVEEMERGYMSRDGDIRRLQEENMVLKAAQLATENITGGFRKERETPTPPPSFVPVQFQGENPVVPISDLRQELLQAARTAAQETVSGILTPLQKLGNANATIRSSYPDFAQNETAFTGWLRDNPRYQDLIQHDPDVGLEAAYLKYARESGSVQARQATETTVAAQRQVESARSQAAPAGGIAPGSRRPTEAESKWGELQKLFQVWQTTGSAADKKRYLDARVAFGIGDQVMAAIEQTRWGR